jgi:uncharacterized protein YcbK (DUF882 family)
MITLKELNKNGYKTTPEQDANLAILLERMNKVRAAYGKPMTVTSGLRSDADQARINPKAPKSKHLLGQACDIKDPNGELDEWCKANVKLLEEIGLWIEDAAYTVGWTHFQIVGPKSGRRFFIP